MRLDGAVHSAGRRSTQRDMAARRAARSARRGAHTQCGAQHGMAADVECLHTLCAVCAGLICALLPLCAKGVGYVNYVSVTHINVGYIRY